MTKLQPVNHHRKRIPWVRISILIAAVSFFLASALLWILNNERIIQGDWSSILPILFTVLGVLLALCQWLFPFSIGESKVSLTDPPSTSSVPSPLQEIKRQWLDEGITHFNAEHYNSALSAYEKVLELDPKCIEAYTGKGKVLLNIGQYQEALSAFEKALELDSTNYNAYVGKGNALLSLDPARSDKILTSFEIAARLEKRIDPDTFPTTPEINSIEEDRLVARHLNLAVGAFSNSGIKRKHKPNEDSLFAIKGARTHNSQAVPFGLFMVADGMGGHSNGQDASRLAIQTLIDFILLKITTTTNLADGYLKLLEEGVQHANQAVHQRNLEERADMGTTMTAALVVGAMAYVANVGDSRTYLYHEPQGLIKITQDHSVVASLVEAGIIKPDDIYTHPKRNQIYRSLGEKPTVYVDSFKVSLQVGDKVLLCSDGLWDMVRDPDIQRLMSAPAPDPAKTGKELIQAALAGGGEDNVSVIVVSITESSAQTGMTGIQLLAIPDSFTVPDLPPM